MWPLDHIGPSDLVAGHGIGPEGGMDLLDLSLVVSLSFMEPVEAQRGRDVRFKRAKPVCAQKQWSDRFKHGLA